MKEGGKSPNERTNTLVTAKAAAAAARRWRPEVYYYSQPRNTRLEYRGRRRQHYYASRVSQKEELRKGRGSGGDVLSHDDGSKRRGGAS